MHRLKKVFSNLIETHELAKLLEKEIPIYFLDATCNIPGVQLEALDGHRDRRLPGAKFFEVNEIADKSTGLPHMLPTTSVFIEYMKRLRIRNDGRLLVLYDQMGVVTSPRVWWTFKVFGRTNIAVLNGGLPKWVKEDLPTESGIYDLYGDVVSQPDEEYRYRLDHSQVFDLKATTALSKLIQSGETDTQILDARAPGRFNGTAPEPRAGLPSGNIPGSVNVFFKDLFQADGTLKSVFELREIYTAAGICVDNTRRVVNLCGSGMTACINLLALETLGKTRTGVFDGSWTEYVSDT